MNLPDPPSKPYLSELDLVVRMYDIDFNGHVNNIVYIRWLEDMRMVGFEKICPLRSLLDAGQIPVLIRTDIQYKQPIKMFDQPKGVLWLHSFTKTNFAIEAEIRVNLETKARAIQTCVFVNASGRLIRMPQSLLRSFENLQAMPEKTKGKELCH